MKQKLPPTHQAAIDRLKNEGQVKWKGTTGNESRALLALVKKGFVSMVFQPFGHTYFELHNQPGKKRHETAIR